LAARGCRTTGLFAALLLALPAAGQDRSKGAAAYLRGDYAAALKEWRPLAEQGYSDAQFNLGVMYAKGEGVRKDYPEAAKWFRRAAEQAADPPLVLESSFAGQTEGDGTFVNSWTGAERRFRVAIAGTWDGTTLTLVEDFDFADGEKDRKSWRLRRTGPGEFTGTREAVIGEACAWTDGRVVRLRYTARVEGWALKFDDVLALRTDGSLLNRAVAGKGGIRVGRVELVLRRRQVI